nr:cytochrome c oxidase subunit 2 [Diodontus sp. a EB-2023]WRY74202.1 cytochrome c oxidase subunit 2 [Diodontus sp. a EB-2023]WRY74209.1 cytochrome c oxidase subunit 2 [Diodontus sp. a EB-2023]
MFTWNMLTLQDSASPIFDYLLLFYDTAMMMIIMITSLTLYLMTNIMLNKFTNRFLLQGHLIEIIWTIAPMFILLFLAIPSLKVLYSMDELWNPIYFTIKIIGNQWYWSYEYSEFSKMKFDSYMSPWNNSFNFRLLDTDNRLILPTFIPIRLLITSNDVIHSWAIPSLGIKLDAIPGRINQIMYISTRIGVFFGQCSEICGANHSFMPIMIESTNFNHFIYWINK